MGSDPRNYKIARKERYIDEEGTQREAVSYSVEEGLTIWYDMDEIKQAIPLWKPHREDLYENTRYFFKGLKMKKEDNTCKQHTPG